MHIKKIKPLFTSLVTTGNRFEEAELSEGGVITANKGDLKLYQTVIAVGPAVRDIKVGDTVWINVENYAVKRYSKNSVHTDMDDNPTTSYQLNWITLYDDNDVPQHCLFLNDRDIQFVFEGVEEEKSNIVVPENPIIV